MHFGNVCDLHSAKRQFDAVDPKLHLTGSGKLILHL